jgi:hypothetical protein
METRKPPQFEPPPLDMTLDGQFRDPPVVPVVAQIGRMAIVVAVMAAAGAVALLALWFALALIPVALGAGLVAYGVLRYQRWRGQGIFARPPGPFGGR